MPKKGGYSINHNSNYPNSAPKPKPGMAANHGSSMNAGKKERMTPSLKKGANVKGVC